MADLMATARTKTLVLAWLTRLTTPCALPEGGVLVASILGMVALFAIDYATREAIQLHVLYVFPLAAIVLHCRRGDFIVFAFLLSVGFQIVTLLSYPLPSLTLVTDAIVAWAASALTVGLASAARRHYLRLIAQASTDPLTGLHNRRHFEAALDLLAARQSRYGGVFSLVILDLDRFKSLNDLKGHRSGDEALRLLAGILRRQTRASDSVARIGGDEFAILMPNADEASCIAYCRKLDTTIAEQMNEGGFAITASIGHETFHQVADTSRALQLVDEAMYSAKRKTKSA